MAIKTLGGYTLERDFVEGDVVKMISTDPVFKFGAVETEDIGYIQHVTPGEVFVNFPAQPGWIGKREEFVLVRPAGGFKEGDIVKVITDKPKIKGMVGKVELVNGEELTLYVYGVRSYWSCKESEVALAWRELKMPPSKFDVGDIVIGNDENDYAITRKDAYCVVVEVHGNGFISVMTVDGQDDTAYMVKDDMFDYVTTMDDLDGEVDKIEEAIKVERELLKRVTDHVEQLKVLKQAAQGGINKKIKKYRIEKGYIEEIVAQESGGNEVFFENRANVTVCLVQNGKGIAIGIAICSPNDEFDELTGRYVALKRAVGKDHEVKELCI